VEAHNFDIRKQLLEYDNVANDQRKHVYELRNEILAGEHAQVEQRVKALRDGVITDYFRAHVPAESVEEQWDVEGLERVLAGDFKMETPVRRWLEAEPNLTDEDLLQRVIATADEHYAARMGSAPPEIARQYEHFILLRVLDDHWREHLAALDHLRQGIHLRGYAQKNPKQEYKREAFELFGHLLDTVKLEVTKILMNVQIRSEEEVQKAEQQAPAVENVRYQHADYEEALVGAGADADEELARAAQRKPSPPPVRALAKVGRNDPCPCGSGKKYKHCHGKLS
jgi:preprotein translocase subunit SecA